MLRSPSPFLASFERFFTACRLHQDFDFLLGLLERGLAVARELDALFEFFHRLFLQHYTIFMVHRLKHILC